VRYVPDAQTPPSPSPPASALTPVVRRTVHDLHAEADGRAWAARLGHVGSSLGRRTAAHLVPDTAAAWPAGAIGDNGADPVDGDRLVGLLALLRAETTRYVCALRAEGARPEQMLVQVKAFVHQAMVAEAWFDPEATRALTAEVVRWSIDAYYDR